MIIDPQLVGNGILMTISLIMTLSVAEIMVESERWNEWANVGLMICNVPLLLVFACIVTHKILMVL
jgi:hypothetical protein